MNEAEERQDQENALVDRSIDELLQRAEAIHEACCTASTEHLADAIKYHANEDDWQRVVDFANHVLRIDKAKEDQPS